MGRLAANGALGRGGPPTHRKHQTGNALANGGAGSASRMGLLELQLRALVDSVRCVPPGQGGASPILDDFITFLKQFLLESFRPTRIRLDGNIATKSGCFYSESGTALFCRIPANAKATEPEWDAPQPGSVEVIGSCGATLGPAAFARNIDLAFEIPESCLNKRDYLNYRYLAKRAAYVDAIHAQLKEALASAELQGSWQWAKACKGRLRVESVILPWRFDSAKTFISLRLLPVGENNGAGSAGSDRVADRIFRQLQQWEIRLFPSCPTGMFNEKLLRPNANAVRRRTTATRGVSGSSHAPDVPLTEAEVKKLPPTPYYNGLVLEDTRLLRHSEILRECVAKYPGFADAVLLLKAWAKRRALLASGSPPFSPASGVCGFTLSLVLAHVCRAHADVARIAAPVQLFRLTLSFLATADFREHVYCFGKEEGIPKTGLTESSSALLDAAVASRNEAASTVAATPSAAAAAAGVYQELKMHAGPWGQRELCVGLVEDACLFDSVESTFNILWRAQLHIKAATAVAFAVRCNLGVARWLLSAQELQHEAHSSLAALQAVEDPFLLLFGEQQEQLLLKSDLWTLISSLPPCGDSYDVETSFPVANYDAPEPGERHVGQEAFEEETPTKAPRHFDPPKWEAAPAFLGAATLGRLIVRGLGDRLLIFRLRFSPCTPTSILLPNPANRSSVDKCPVGVLLFVTLSGKASARLLDRGPPVVDATETESRAPSAIVAESFRRFWGPRCDVRRFQDGRMLHCVLWERFTASEGPVALERSTNKAEQSQSPPEQIVRAVLARHAAQLYKYTVPYAKLETPSEPRPVDKDNSLQPDFLDISCSPLGPNGSLSERQKALIRAFAALKNLLCALSSVPLTIKQIWHSDAALRHTEVVESNTWDVEKAEAGTVHPIVVQFEDSGKWPVEREAVRKLKTAFLVAMNEELLRDYSIASNVMESYLDVNFQSFIFRVQIFHPNEVAEEANIFTDFSLKPITTQFGKATGSSCGESVSSIKHSVDGEMVAKELCDTLLQEDVAFLSSISPYTKDRVADLRSLWWAPQVSAMAHSLALKHAAFAGAVRLAVLWLSKQLVVGAVHFAEHVMAFLFVDHLRAGYGDEPNSPHVALLRFLHFVGSFDWEQNALLVSFDTAAPLSDEQRQQMQVSFERFRLFPSVHSLIDPHGFILPRPEPASFRRLLRCARDCSQEVSEAMVAPRRLASVWKGLFCTDWRQFDIIVKLKDPLAAPRVQSTNQSPQKKRRFANLAFDSDTTEQQKESILEGLLQQEGSTDLFQHLSARGFHLSPTAPETAAVLDSLLLRALGSRACIRRYLFLRFLRRLYQAFPDAFVVGFDFVHVQQLAGGLPDAVALKIRPAALLCRSLQPTAASSRLLFCPSWATHGDSTATDKEKCKEEGSTPAVDEKALMAVFSPSMLLGGVKAIGLGLLEEVLLM